jgi:hypothetical protein
MPLSKYFVDFTAYVDERRRPENFPKEVHDKQVFEVESIPHLQYLVNERFIKLVTSAGMVVLKDEDEPLEEGKITFDRRVFVSWGILTHMTVSVRLISDGTPINNLIVPGHPVPDKPKEVVN